MDDVIRLLDSTGEKLLDSVSEEYEDSFCLESFGDLAQAHYECEPKGTRCLIIARVQTWDPKQPDKAFYSYYNAYHLNKILFQTQVYLGKKLIHRLHVLNPLTNTDIIGNVLYFMVKRKAAASNNADGGVLADTEVSGSKEKVVIIPLGTERSFFDEKYSGDVKTFTSSTPSSGFRALKPVFKIDTSVVVQEESGGGAARNSNIPKSTTVRDFENGNLQQWTMNSPMVALAKDEEEDEEAVDVNSESKSKISTPANTAAKFIRKLSLISTPLSASSSRFKKSTSTPVTGIQMRNINTGSKEEKQQRNSLASSPIQVISFTLPYTPTGQMTTSINSAPLEDDQGCNANIRRRAASAGVGGVQKVDIIEESEKISVKRRHTTVNITTRLASGPVTLGNTSKTRQSVPLGVVTRFAVPVAVDEIQKSTPKTTKSRRRTLSYANSVSIVGRNTSLKEWRNMVREEQHLIHQNEQSGNSDEAVGDYDSIPSELIQRHLSSAKFTGRSGQSPSSSYSIGLGKSPMAKTPLSSTTIRATTSPLKGRITMVKEEDVEMGSMEKVGSRDDLIEKSAKSNEEETDGYREENEKVCVESQDGDEVEDEDQAAVKWDGHLFATDTDFLEQSKIRIIFKDNAIEPEDAQLFRMPDYTGEEQPPAVVVQETSALCEFCYPSQSTLQNSSYCMRIFHYFKCYLLAIFIMFGVFFFIFYTLKDSTSPASSNGTNSTSTGHH